MGTRGLIVIKFKGIYYYLYNKLGSFPSELGKLLEKMIRNIYDQPEDNPDCECKDVDLCTCDIYYYYGNMSIDYQFAKILSNCSNLVGYLSGTTTNSILEITDDFSKIESNHIEWFYIINLDNHTFSILGGYYEPVYDLYIIPYNWFQHFKILNERISIENEK